MERNARTHGEARHGRITHEYKTWQNLKARVKSTAKNTRPYYLDKGIKVCDRWLGTSGYANFLEDMGRRPSAQHSIDRINNDGNYEPSNCRWATKEVQANNQQKHTAKCPHCGELLWTWK